jgi:hypothetical protein
LLTGVVETFGRLFTADIVGIDTADAKAGPEVRDGLESPIEELALIVVLFTGGKLVE